MGDGESRLGGHGLHFGSRRRPATGGGGGGGAAAYGGAGSSGGSWRRTRRGGGAAASGDGVCGGGGGGSLRAGVVVLVAPASPLVHLVHVDDEVEVGPLVGVVPGLMEGGDEDAVVLAALALQGLHGGGHRAAELPVRATGLRVEQRDLKS